ncbi:hypothetical protein TSUD_332260 [Trifolium subterraneum]|uniref:Uncharacterized protein n=1 Tax=Trifolium subterraneum TaxID=3900 RepID=A0A2Z6NJX2_TRISU|nr:hypothetical protein TSUD_332260 [Trifolium subterraneum]
MRFTHLINHMLVIAAQHQGCGFYDGAKMADMTVETTSMAVVVKLKPKKLGHLLLQVAGWFDLYVPTICEQTYDHNRQAIKGQYLRKAGGDRGFTDSSYFPK